MISKIMSRDATIGKEETTMEQIQQLQENEKLKIAMRNCRSFKDLRIIDEDFAEDEDDGI